MDISAVDQDVDMTDLGDLDTTSNLSLNFQETDNSHSFVLSENVLRSLDITNAQEKGSLYKLLNRCTTTQGSRLLMQFLKRPLTDLDEIHARLDLVEFFVNKSGLRLTISDVHLKKFPDFVPLVKKLMRKKVALMDLYKIYVAVMKIPELNTALTSEMEDVSDGTKSLLISHFVDPFKKATENFANYKDLIEQTIDIKHLLSTNVCRIKPDVAEELGGLNAKLEDIETRMQEDWKRLGKEVQMELDKTLKFERDARLGYLYRVTNKEEKNLRKKFEELGLKEIDNKTSGFRFRTRKLDKLNEKFLEATKEYDVFQEGVIAELVNTAETFAKPLKEFDRFLAPLDVFVALAKVACDANIPYVRPEILPKETGLIHLERSRHPCMETFMTGCFIPNSVLLEHDKSSFHIITGPNMGGKSTYIRQVALNIIMAQIGSFVPCDSARISIIDGVFTRIGASDSVEKGVSTFMMEMMETHEILAGATKHSLIVIDELGRGTSTYDGYGLAYAISEHIATELGAYCLFTTHFTELAELADKVECVTLSHVTALEINERQLVFKYSIEPGVCMDSFGINCAQIAGLPAQVVQNAQGILKELENAHHIGSTAIST